MSKRILMFAALLGLMACEPVSENVIPFRNTIEIPKYFYDGALNAGIAGQIAAECSGLEYNSKKAAVYEAELTERARADGLTKAQDIIAGNNLPERQLQKDLFAYIQKRKIVVVSPDTWCAAGRAEISEKTEIGNLLLEKG
ncbi:DUF5333 family protein [Roseobacter sp.]|uniref:DUF5333 family protein n=1 Tax=Roseobacter sp. TaxID=1907202 RepID=UPI00385E1231